MKTHTLVSKGDHRWLILGQDPERPANVADTNQLVIVESQSAALVDPGGIEVFPAFLSTLTASVSIERIKHVILTSPDPDALSALPLWRQVCRPETRFHAPSLWLDLAAHLDATCEFTRVPEDGGRIDLADETVLGVIPASYLHAPGALSVYDPELKALYAGAVGSAPNTAGATGAFVVDDFNAHLAFLDAFHSRWFASTRARDAWLQRIADLRIDYLLPHRGPALEGSDVERFLDWFADLPLGSVPPVPAKSEPVMQPEPESEPDPQPESDGEDESVSVDSVSDEPAEEAPAEPKDKLSEDAEAVLAELMGLDASDDTEAEPPGMRGKPEPGAEFRLVTRSDFDGLVCAVLLEELEMIDDILFVHPNDMQEGRVPINDKDITTNLPYVPGCYLAFDHHLSEVARVGKKHDNHIINPDAPSAARVVYEYYGGKGGFPTISEEMMAAVDQGDSAQYEMEDVLNPERWALLNFIMDSRTGLGRFRGFRIPNYELMMSLIEYCGAHTIDEILEIDDVKERVDFYREQESLFKEQIQRCTTMHGKLAVLNLLDEEDVYVGNRFMVYALFPESNISMHVMWGRDRQNVVFAVGKSIFDKSSKVNIGELMLQYGGGGHHAAGTCQADPLLAETVKQALIQKINEVDSPEAAD